MSLILSLSTLEKGVWTTQGKMNARRKARPKPQRRSLNPQDLLRPIHDPTKYPDGTPVPAGYNWDGVRLVRNKKGSKRPPDVPSEFWHMYSAQQRKEEIERWERKVAREEAKRKVCKIPEVSTRSHGQRVAKAPVQSMLD